MVDVAPLILVKFRLSLELCHCHVAVYEVLAVKTFVPLVVAHTESLPPVINAVGVLTVKLSTPLAQVLVPAHVGSPGVTAHAYEILDVVPDGANVLLVAPLISVQLPGMAPLGAL